MPAPDPLAAVQEARASSDLIRALEQSRELGCSGVRLSPAQIQALEAGGSSSADWSRVRVSPGFRPEFVRASRFEGDVYLGEFGAPVDVGPGIRLSSGVYGSTVVDSAIGDGALVRDVRLLARAAVLGGAALLDVGEVTGLPRSRFACGVALRLGNELGGREVLIYPEIALPVAWRIARDRTDARLQSAYSQAVRSYAQDVSSEVTVISPGVRVLHTSCVRGSYLGPGALVDGALLVEESSVLSTDGEGCRIALGAVVRRSVIQWGSRVSAGAVVEESALLERSSVERHAKVSQSIIGPCSTVERGEVASSLLGPLVAMHHQSLLVGVLWPGGKGNVGAGALVGSNHTGRAPDQEAHLGEGLFLGLGAAMKFPADLSRAPYTVLAAGLTIGPQRIEFPFSLLREAASDLVAKAPQARPGVHEILPAWVLTESPYTLARAEQKFAQRYRARRQAVDPDPLRPEVLELVRQARSRLRSAPQKELYTSADIPGLGPNLMTEAARLRAVAGYTFALVYKALLGLWARVRRSRSSAEAFAEDPAASPDAADEVAAWRLHRAILEEERAGSSLRALLSELVEMQAEFAGRVEESKAKDDARGTRIVEGYADAREPASADKVVVAVREDTEVLRRDVEEFLATLGGEGPRLAPRGDART